MSWSEIDVHFQYDSAIRALQFGIWQPHQMMWWRLCARYGIGLETRQPTFIAGSCNLIFGFMPKEWYQQWSHDFDACEYLYVWWMLQGVGVRIDTPWHSWTCWHSSSDSFQELLDFSHYNKKAHIRPKKAPVLLVVYSPYVDVIVWTYSSLSGAFADCFRFVDICLPQRCWRLPSAEADRQSLLSSCAIPDSAWFLWSWFCAPNKQSWKCNVYSRKMFHWTFKRLISRSRWRCVPRV